MKDTKKSARARKPFACRSGRDGGEGERSGFLSSGDVLVSEQPSRKGRNVTLHREIIMARLTAERAAGRAIFDALCGSGITAKMAAQGGANMVTTHCLAY